MANPRLKKAFQRTRRATRDAFSNVRTATGRESSYPDPDVALFQRLTPAHFRVLASKYGEDNVKRYIATMERRING